MSKKMLFICSSLEPGRDGVGDYARLLAVELSRLGCECAALALNDHYSTVDFSGIQESNNEQLYVLRLPAAWSAKRRYQYAESWINDFKPDVISIQYVGFGYNKYGLPFDMILLLPKLLKGFKTHIMFHELWCGMGPDIGPKEKLLGFLQKKFIQVFIARTKPDKAFTNIVAYSSDLAQIGLNAQVVPIFGNIKLGQLGSPEDFESVISKANMVALANAPAEYLVLGFFGTIYPYGGLSELLFGAARIAKTMGKKLGIICIGHNRGQNIADIVGDAENISIWNTGMLNHDMINKVSEFIDLGMITSQAEAVDKSGSAIAWIERAIPILISKDDYTYVKEILEPLGVFQIKRDEDILKAINIKPKLIKESRLSGVASNYFNLL